MLLLATLNLSVISRGLYPSLPVVNRPSVHFLTQFGESNTRQTKFFAAGGGAIMFIRAIVAVRPAIAALLGTNALRLVLALPRALPVAQCTSTKRNVWNEYKRARSPFFVFPVDAVLESIANATFKCGVALCLAAGRR